MEGLRIASSIRIPRTDLAREGRDADLRAEVVGHMDRVRIAGRVLMRSSIVPDPDVLLPSPVAKQCRGICYVTRGTRVGGSGAHVRGEPSAVPVTQERHAQA